MRNLLKYPWWLLGCLVLLSSALVAGTGIKHASAHLVPLTPAPGPAVVLDDINLGKRGAFGLIEYSGNKYRPRSTAISFGSVDVHFPMTAPWLLGTTALFVTGLALLFIPMKKTAPATDMRLAALPAPGSTRLDRPPAHHED